MSDYLKGKRAVDPALTSIARDYKSTAFIGERIFPIVLTDKEGMHVPTSGKAVSAEYNTECVVGTDSNILIREKTDTLDLVSGRHDLAAPVDYREQAEPMFNEESKVTHRTTNGVNPRRELIATRLAQDKKIYRTGHVKKLAASDRWASGKGDFIGVIEADIEAVRTATGLCPDLMTMGAGVMALLKFHPMIQAAIGTNEHKRITAETLQDLPQVKEIITGASVSLPFTKAAMDKNNAPTDIWGDNLILHHIGKPQPGADNADENEPSSSYTLRRKKMPATDRYDGAGGKVKYCHYVGVYKIVVVGGDAGYLIIGISKQGGVMRTIQQVILITIVMAGVALAQQRFVGVDNTPCEADAAVLRVTEVDVVTGDNTSVSVLGIIAVETGAAVSHGVAVQSDARARAVLQSGDGESRGIALDKTGGEGDAIRVLRGV